MVTQPSALVTDRGKRVFLRIKGRIYDLGQDDLRARLGVSAGPPGLGITIDGNRFCFEFADDQTVELTVDQLCRRISKQPTGRK
jgi:hypothetical protein